MLIVCHHTTLQSSLQMIYLDLNEANVKKLAENIKLLHYTLICLTQLKK